jgi:hypothetical protein
VWREAQAGRQPCIAKARANGGRRKFHGGDPYREQDLARGVFEAFEDRH